MISMRKDMYPIRKDMISMRKDMYSMRKDIRKDNISMRKDRRKDMRKDTVSMRNDTATRIPRFPLVPESIGPLGYLGFQHHRVPTDSEDSCAYSKTRKISKSPQTALFFVLARFCVGG